jgi:hypothetical protein
MDLSGAGGIVFVESVSQRLSHFEACLAFHRSPWPFSPGVSEDTTVTATDSGKEIDEIMSIITVESEIVGWTTSSARQRVEDSARTVGRWESWDQAWAIY